MTTANVYLSFEGNCEEAFNFYKSVIGGEFSHTARFKEMPEEACDPPIPEQYHDKIMHISLPVSKETMIMGSDVGGEWAPGVKFGNNFSISLSTGSKEEADRLFNGLAEGGQVTMPIASTFWGDYFGMFTDKFGINWMVSFNENPHK